MRIRLLLKAERQAFDEQCRGSHDPELRAFSERYSSTEADNIVVATMGWGDPLQPKAIRAIRGFVRLSEDDDALLCLGTWVDASHRREGIAEAMWCYVMGTWRPRVVRGPVVHPAMDALIARYGIPVRD